MTSQNSQSSSDHSTEKIYVIQSDDEVDIPYIQLIIIYIIICQHKNTNSAFANWKYNNSYVYFMLFLFIT
jgi:hypothetical protein